MKRTGSIPAWAAALALVGFQAVAWASHEPVVLKGYDGKELALDSKAPYSPKATCGECHEYARITNGYHFQQGRTDGSGKIVVSDSFNPTKPWILSSGMYGKW